MDLAFKLQMFGSLRNSRPLACCMTQKICLLGEPGGLLVWSMALALRYAKPKAPGCSLLVTILLLLHDSLLNSATGTQLVNS
jgi:hypothetical protein